MNKIISITSTARVLMTALATFTFVSQHAMAATRGYVTTPQELATIATKAAQGIQPYKNSVLSIKNFANTGSSSIAGSTANPTYWPYGTMSGDQECTATFQPGFIANGGPLVEAKAMAYRLTGDTRYAQSARNQLVQLATTHGYGGTNYSGSNQCILNISWYLPAWIITADLLEGFPGWTSSDKFAFQRWLGTEIFRKVQWSSDAVINNWGSAGSLTTAMIADYLANSTVALVDRKGATISAHNAFLAAKQHQLDRMNGNSYMISQTVCPSYDNGKGIRPDGGIPWELRRGSTGCDGLWTWDLDPSWTYTQTHLATEIAHAELLFRRGDASLYTNITASGAGSMLKAIYFQIHNPTDPSKSVSWKSNRMQELEFVYRFWATRGALDPYIGKQLGVGTSSRYIGGINNPTPHFGTITHGFAVGERPALPPMVPAP